MRTLIVTLSLFLTQLQVDTFYAYADDTADFKRNWAFPTDDGSHPEFSLEWWYFTGQLFETGDAAVPPSPAIGFQLAFFRRKLESNQQGEWGQGYLAHAAISDFKAQSFQFEERQAQGGIGIAGASPSLLRVWNGPWMVEEAGDSILLRYEIGSGSTKKRVRLVLENVPPWFQGLYGKSAKGICAECYSYYYSRPRMKVTGSLEDNEGSRALSGYAWMDHEFMNSLLQPKDAGWDWFGLMIEPSTELMAFRIRGKDGKISYSSGALRRNGETIQLDERSISLEPLEFWTSESSRASYPISWRIHIPSAAIDVKVSAKIRNQELSFKNGSVAPTYWEGAVESPDGAVRGYLEMTGYSPK